MWSFVIGTLLILASYFVVFKNQTWIIAGYNILDLSRISPKKHSAVKNLIGMTYLLLGVILIAAGLLRKFGVDTPIYTIAATGLGIIFLAAIIANVILAWPIIKK